MNWLSTTPGRAMLAFGALALLGAGAAAYFGGALNTQAGEPPQPSSLIERAAGAFPGATSPSQAAILSDNAVTTDELRDAVNRTGDCLEAAGLEAVRPGDPRLKGYIRTAYVVPAGLDLASADAAHQRCIEEFSNRVEMAYSMQNSPSVEPGVRRALIVRCLRERGVSVGDDLDAQVPGLIRDEASRPVFLACANAEAR